MKRQGFVLTFAMIAALLIAIVCMALMAMVSNEAQRARFERQRTQSAYASEAGVAWAQANLLTDPCWVPPGPVPGITPSVTVTVATCAGCSAATPCASRKITTKVAY